MDLRPCPACARHVFQTEAACPFCGETLRPSPSPIFTPPPGASRAQLYALAAAMLGQGLVGCTESVVPTPGVPILPQGGATAGAPAAGRAAAVAGTSGAGTAGRAANAGSFAQPVYGAPLPPDAGVPTAGSRAGTGGAGGAGGTGSGGAKSDAGAGSAAGTAGETGAKAGSGGRGGAVGGQVAVPLYGAPPRAGT